MAPVPRLAFVTPRFSATATVGGAETLLKALALRAARAGCNVTILTTCATDHFTWNNARPPGREEHEGVAVEYFSVDPPADLDVFYAIQNRISAGTDVSSEDQQTWLSNQLNSEALCNHLREAGDRYDRVIAGPYLFSLIHHVARAVPEKLFLVPCLHDEPYAYLSCMRDLFASAAGFLFNAEPERQLAARIFDVSDSSGTVVGMGLEPFEADATAFARRHRLTAPYILYSGRREYLKGTPLLCDYMTAFRHRNPVDIKLVFTGSGPIEAPPELTPHILDVGFVSEQEKHEAMAGALAFVHPSVNESFGIVLMEAWLARVPALVHAGGEVLKWQCRRSGGGLWFRHYPDFEEALLMLIDEPELRKRMGLAGRAFVEQEYAWSTVATRFFDALNIQPPATGRVDV